MLVLPLSNAIFKASNANDFGTRRTTSSSKAILILVDTNEGGNNVASPIVTGGTGVEGSLVEGTGVEGSWVKGTGVEGSSLRTLPYEIDGTLTRDILEG